MKTLCWILAIGLLAIGCNPNKKEATNSTPISVCGTPESAALLKLLDTTRQIAPLLTNLGSYGFRITTTSPEAQSFFNQGLNLYYGFNHLEAYRSFREAARLDPSCAMCWWGQALSLGPNINAPMDPSDASLVYRAVRRAQVNSTNVSELEKGLIDAVSRRYVAEAPADRAPLDKAYAEAMVKLEAKFPTVDEVTTLTAEALMDLHPWDFWLKDGSAQPWTGEIVALMEKVMKRSGRHPGANHLYIHIHEASSNPGKATPSADLLRDLVPGAGHLVHMPSHIYIRTGRYAEGIAANEKAVAADESYISSCRAQGIYPLSYYPHNYHFYWACAQMSGRGKLALEVSRMLVSKMAVSKMAEPDWVTLQHYYVTPWYSMVRFRQWDELAREQRPPDSLLYVSAIWTYAQGMAAVKTGNAKEARLQLNNLKTVLAKPELAKQSIWAVNKYSDVVGIAAGVLESECEAAEGKYNEAIRILGATMQKEDNLLYQEPPDWFFPVRETYGTILLKAKKFKEAESRFGEDLSTYPENGWSLAGLYKALKAQNKEKEAAQVKKRFDKAFADADEPLKDISAIN